MICFGVVHIALLRNSVLLLQACLLGAFEKLSNAEVLAGITVRSAEALGIKDTEGAFIVMIVDDSPADKAGLKEKDVIIALNSIPIEDSNQLRNDVSSMRPNDVVVFSVIRNELRQSISVILGERPSDGNENKINPNTQTYDKIGLKIDNHKDAWVVNILSGKINFAHGIPHIAISIASFNDGQISSGCIYDPIRKELFYCEAGKGSYLNEKRIRVSGRDLIMKSLINCGSDNLGINDIEKLKLSGSQIRISGWIPKPKSSLTETT